MQIASNETPADLMARLDAAIMAEPRMTRLAGGPEDTLVTYIGRTRMIGFPDYITVKVESTDNGSRATILSRLRFGKSDMGVNDKRLTRVLERADLSRAN